jgi:hypothetical protein
VLAVTLGGVGPVGGAERGQRLLGKVGQQSPVQRLCGQLVAETLGVLPGYGVVAAADSVMARDGPLHDESLYRLPLDGEPAGPVHRGDCWPFPPVLVAGAGSFACREGQQRLAGVVVDD